MIPKGAKAILFVQLYCQCGIQHFITTRTMGGQKNVPPPPMIIRFLCIKCQKFQNSSEIFTVLLQINSKEHYLSVNVTT